MKNNLYQIKDIQNAVEGKIPHPINENIFFTEILIDSRKDKNPSSSVFFSLSGDRHNGHDYIKEMYLKGVRNFVIEQEQNFSEYKEANFLLVDNCLKALQEFTAYHRSQFNIPVIAVTGSNGKTIIKEWLFQLLKEHYSICRSPKSFNSQVGVPLSVWQINSNHDLALFEAGISQPFEMQKLEKIIQPTFGIISNIGQAHDENFLSWEEKVAEKIQLFYNCENIIYCKDYVPIHEVLISNSNTKRKNLISWSQKTSADLQVGKFRQENGETFIQAVYKNQFIDITIPFIDHASVENAIHCWVTMLSLGIGQLVIQEKMRSLSPVAMRLEMKEGINGCSIINDSYNSDIDGINIALDFLNQQKGFEKKTVILSDILESGQHQEELYQKVSSLLDNKGIARLIGIGEAIQNEAKSFPMETFFFPTTEDFIQHFNEFQFTEEIILLKGARNFSFEKISKLLQKKAHETVLEIDLGKLTNNLNFFRARLKKTTQIMAMVKAFSYGSGSYEIASALQFHRVNYLGVAYADEGVELRRSGISLPIMVMNPEHTSYDNMIHHYLEPEVFSFRGFSLFEEALARNPFLEGKAYPIHIKIDTGMKRLGFSEDELPKLIMRIKNNKRVQIKTIFSHLAGSDASIHDAFTKNQIDRLNRCADTISGHFDYKINRHILNTNGILRFPEAQMDMVRLGIGLYGVCDGELEQRNLQEVSTLKTTISQLKKIKSGDTVGYSRIGKSSEDMIIATIPIGYADGLRRSLGNGVGKMMVNGHKVSIIGNVCMDMCMLDVTYVPAQEGDEVIVFGEQYSIKDFAKDMDTIPYEALTGISPRVKRIYFQE